MKLRKNEMKLRKEQIKVPKNFFVPPWRINNPYMVRKTKSTILQNEKYNLRGG